MALLRDYARTLRSKNAGAYVLTVDIMFKTSEGYREVCASGRLTPETVAALYRVAPADVRVTPYPEVHAIKVTLPRLIPSGDVGDSDVYGAQQHVPLMMLEI